MSGISLIACHSPGGTFAGQVSKLDLLSKVILCTLKGGDALAITTPVKVMAKTGDRPLVDGTLMVQVAFDANMHPVVESCRFFYEKDGEVHEA